jgi:hypothetical protein
MKRITRKLNLTTETVRRLDDDALARIAGGWDTQYCLTGACAQTKYCAPKTTYQSCPPMCNTTTTSDMGTCWGC